MSGVQPSGNLHIGNYLGAIKNFVNIQNNFNCFFCIVDLHAITVKQDPKVLKRAVIADPFWWADNGAEVHERFGAWKGS